MKKLKSQKYTIVKVYQKSDNILHALSYLENGIQAEQLFKKFKKKIINDLEEIIRKGSTHEKGNDDFTAIISFLNEDCDLDVNDCVITDVLKKLEFENISLYNELVMRVYGTIMKQDIFILKTRTEN